MPTVTTANKIELEPSSLTALTSVVSNTENTNRAITNGDVTSSNAFDGAVPSGTETNGSVVLAGTPAPATHLTIGAPVPNGEEHKSVEQNSGELIIINEFMGYDLLILKPSGTNANEKTSEQFVPTTTMCECLPENPRYFNEQVVAVAMENKDKSGSSATPSTE